MESFETKLKADLARKGKSILEAARAAMKLDVVFSSESRKLPREVQKALGFYSRFLSFYSKAGGPLVPKTHFMVHLIQRALFKGNPKKYNAYRDESFNGMIAKIARSCHRRTRSNVIHWKCQSLHTKNHSKIRKSKIFEKKHAVVHRASPSLFWEDFGILLENRIHIKNHKDVSMFWSTWNFPCWSDAVHPSLDSGTSIS